MTQHTPVILVDRGDYVAISNGSSEIGAINLMPEIGSHCVAWVGANVPLDAPVYFVKIQYDDMLGKAIHQLEQAIGATLIISGKVTAIHPSATVGYLDVRLNGPEETTDGALRQFGNEAGPPTTMVVVPNISGRQHSKPPAPKTDAAGSNLTSLSNQLPAVSYFDTGDYQDL